MPALSTRDVGAGAHRDADIGCGERRRVVDAVAGHGDLGALRAKLLDQRLLALRQHVGADLVDAELCRDGLGGHAALSPVAMMMRQPALVQRADSFAASGLDRIGDGDDAGQPAFDGDEHRCLALRPQRVCRSHRAPAASTPRSAIIAALPSATRRPFTVPVTPLPVTASKSVAARDRRAALPRRLRRSPRPADARNRAPALAASASSRPSSKSFGRDHVGQLRPALGQRAGLVDDQRVDMGEALQRLGVLDQHAGLRAAAGRRHDRHRRRQAQRAGTGDDQHRDRRRRWRRSCRAPDQRAPRRRRRGSRPAPRPARNRPTPGRQGPGSARGCAAPWRPSRRSRDSMVSAPTFSARMTSVPFRLSVPPVTASPSVFSTGSGSPVSMDSSIDERPSITAPSTGTLSPGRTRSRSPDLDLVQRNVSLRAVCRCAAPSSARGRAAPGSPSRCARAPAVPAPGRGTPARR